MGLKLKLFRGRKVDFKKTGLHYDYPTDALWRWRNKDGIWAQLLHLFYGEWYCEL